jgi:hypothetical protein
MAAPLAWLVLFTVLLTCGPGLWAELRFFTAAGPASAGTVLPAPQYNPGRAEVNLAGRLAAAYLPAGTVCVVDTDAWSDDYQRLAFLLLPRNVWPVQAWPTGQLPTMSMVAAALRVHGAACLLARSAREVPPGMGRQTTGAFSLYLRSGWAAP